MEDTTKALKQSGDIEHTISGNIIQLKKQVNKILKKTEEILSR